MSWSLRLFTVRGIPIRVHASFLLILAWAGYIGLSASQESWWRGVVFMITFVLLIFVCVVLHELGHSLVAQLFAVRVEDITLWPIGGVARMANTPEKPYQEFLMTAAGPAINIILAIGLGAITLVVIGPTRLLEMLARPWLVSRFLTTFNIQALLLWLTANNVILALFNLIPAFPMDGGRMLRALLAMFVPFALATRVASLIGQVLATVLGMLALLSGNYFLAFVGLLVFVAAWQERQQTVIRTNLRGLSVRQAMQPVGTRLHPLQTLGDAAAQVAALPQTVYLVIDGGRLVGVSTRAALIGALRRAGPTARVSQHMCRGFVRLHPDDLLETAQDRVIQNSCRGGIVVENDRVVGTLSLADTARLAAIAAAHPGTLLREQ